MTEVRCLHEACSCIATEGEYCSEFCRQNTGDGLETCACGHTDCVGSHDIEVATG